MKKGNAYDHLIIYYFSGTGNARKCAEWIAEKGRNMAMDVHLIKMDRFKEVEIPKCEGKILIGFCSPTHGFNLPPIALKYICQFPKLKNASAFILNTRGGLKMYKIFVPGLSGLAQFFPALILLYKGFKIVGMQPIDLPSNWLLLHPGLRKKVVLSLFQRIERIVDSFSDKILKGGSRFKAFWSLPFDLLVAPIALGYYFVGRFFLAKTLVATSRCDACKLCVKNCPVEAIQWKRGRPFWTWRCESCMRCANICPERAIETAHSFTAFVIYLSVVIGSLLLNKLYLTELLSADFKMTFLSELFWDILVSALMIILIFGSYRVLHYFMGFKYFSKFIEFTSLSRLIWWRRYKPGKILKGRD